MLESKDKTILSPTSHVSVLKEQHVEARKLVSNISRIDPQYQFYVNDYGEMLRRHITMEDEIFPILIEDHLNQMDIQTIMNDFAKEDGRRNLYQYLAILDKIEVLLF